MPANKRALTLRTSVTASHVTCCTSCRYYVDYYNTDRKFNFEVDELLGIVRVRRELDADVQRSFSLHILAVDQGKVALTFAFLYRHLFM